MKWNIINRKNHKVTKINSPAVLSLGNTASSDLFLEEDTENFKLNQLFFFEQFLFIKSEHSHLSFYKFSQVKYFNSIYEFSFENNQNKEKYQDKLLSI